MGPRLAGALGGALDAIVEHADLGLLVHRSGSIVDANDRLGGAAVAGRPVASIVPELGADVTGVVVTRLADGRAVEVRTVAIEHEGAPAMLSIVREPREAVLREVHHRIKNDLQIICSLLSLQAQHLVDPAMRTAFAESQSRVHAIALVHDQLQRARDRRRVELGAYLQQLVEHLARGHAGIAIRFAAGAIEVPVDVATPCGLLVHELVSNALRHAFVDGRRGTITLDVHERDRRVTIRVADDGVGLPLAITPETAQTLGLGLVATFVEQLDATLELVRDGGTAFSITFARRT